MEKDQSKIIIAIDGHSSCGKSTLAQDLAKALGYKYIDTGAMYRAVTLYFLDHDISLDSEEEMMDALSHIKIEFEHFKGQNKTFLNRRDITEPIRAMKINENVSEVAAIPIVRKFLVYQQQEMGKSKGIVMDGRDIGTVVFPMADLKIFLTASAETRAKRRQLEYASKGLHLTLDEVKENLNHRDYIDSNRLDSPLRQADDAILLDNSDINQEEQFELALSMVKRIADKKDHV